MIMETNERLETGRRFFNLFGSRGLFEKRCNRSSLKNLGKDARGQRRVDESREGRKKGMETFHKNRGRNRIMLAGLGADFSMVLLTKYSIQRYRRE